MLSTVNNRALLCALLMHTATHAFHIPFFQDFSDLSPVFTDDTTRSSISIEEVKTDKDTHNNELVIHVTDIDLASNEDATAPIATLEKSAQGTHQTIEVPVSGGVLRITIEDQQFVRATLTRRVEQYRDHEGVVSSSVQQESVSRSYGLDRPLLKDSYELNYNKANRELTIRFQVDINYQEKNTTERIPVNIAVQDK